MIKIGTTAEVKSFVQGIRETFKHVTIEEDYTDGLVKVTQTEDSVILYQALQMGRDKNWMCRIHDCLKPFISTESD